MAHDLEVYQNLVEKSLRERLKAEVMQADPSDTKGVAKIAQLITAELVGGNVTVEVAKAAKEYLELLLASAALNQAREGAANALTDRLEAARAQARKIAKAPRALPETLVEVEIDTLERRHIVREPIRVETRYDDS